MTVGDRASKPPLDDVARYTPFAYLRDSWASIGVGVFLLAGLALMLPVLGVGAQACLLVIGFAALCLISLLALNYLRREAYYRESLRYLAEIGSVTQYSSLIEAPRFLEGRIAHGFIEKLARIAEAENASEREQARAYREYIELWIHETKTPIAAAKLMLANMHGEQAMKLRGELERIEAQVDQALYSARATSVANDYLIKSIQLAKAVRAACKKNMHALVEREIALDFRIGDETEVLADEPWLIFILSQIIGNAAKYGARTITFSTREEEPETPRGRTVLEIHDDGCGMPAADVPRAFDRGFTGSTGRANGSATGMGLYLVAVMCEDMGLGLGIASEENVGTRVMIGFPHDRRRLESA